MNEFVKRVFSMKIRRRRRYRLKVGACVVLNASPGRYQIDDIGYGGLSFHYIDNGYRSSGRSFPLRIMGDNQTVRLNGRTVDENETGELIFHNKKIRRRGIRFETRDRRQKKDLKTFIKNNKI